MVYNQETDLFMGLRDDYTPDLMAKRILEVNSTFTKDIFDQEKLEMNLGVADWGPISTSLLMTHAPEDFNRSSPPCRVETPD